MILLVPLFPNVVCTASAHKLTPEMREAVKKMDEYSEQTRLLCKFNITTLSELNTCKNDFKDKLQELINERKKLYYTRDKLPENQNKEEILNDIIAIGEKITKVRRTHSSSFFEKKFMI